MRRGAICLLTFLILVGCQSPSRSERTYYRQHDRWVDIRVNDGSVDVRVHPEDEDDVNVNVDWP